MDAYGRPAYGYTTEVVYNEPYVQQPQPYADYRRYEHEERPPLGPRDYTERQYSNRQPVESSLSPFPKTNQFDRRPDDVVGHRPEFDQIRPPSKKERRREHPEDDAFSLALSEVTTVKPGHLHLSLSEELMLLKAGDQPKFARKDPTNDAVCAAALLLDLVADERVGPDGAYAVNPRKIVLRVIDDEPTGSKLADSALRNLKTKPKGPPTIKYWLDKAAPDLCSAVLWRLVKKGKLDFDPRTIGPDKFPVRSLEDLNAVRERVVAVIERTDPNPPLKDLFLAFLYYLPNDASGKVFLDRDDSVPEDAHIMAKALFYAVGDRGKTKDSWI